MLCGSARRSRRLFFVRRESWALTLATLLAVAGVSVVAAPEVADAATDSIAVTKRAPESVLVGSPITYSVTASNPQSDDADLQYNLTFRDVLPAGVSYVSTSAPAGLGSPQQVAELGPAPGNVPTGRTILIWSNVADLPDGSDVTLTYTVQPDADAHPVGDTVTNEATAYVSRNERSIAKFTDQGALIPNLNLQADTATATTTISALTIQKSEPSSEAELVRGVHARPTVYTLKVTNNGKAATNGVTVVDYVPAGLEFLGCGTVDNSSAREFAGAASLTSTLAVTPCLTPTSVTTVDSGLPTDAPAGVYTRVEWTLPSNLAAGDTYTVKYAAAIPLRKNVMPTPAAGFVPTANLDNNTGATTRETAGEIGLTNYASTSGRYQGVNKVGQANTVVSDRTRHTVTSEDVAVAKSIVSGGSFSQGGLVTYRLVTRTSEYTDASDIVLVDTLPDGLCPADAAQAVYTSAALAEVGTSECKPATASINPAIKTVDFDPSTNQFTITFKAFDLTASATTSSLTYTARMRATYNTGDEQTSAGDSYTNKVDLTATTTPVGGTGESGSQAVKDDSQASFGSGAPTLDKRVLPNTGAGYSCDDDDWTHWKDSQAAAADTPFTAGSRVCFQVRVAFPENTSTRLPVVTDYLPDNLAYEPGTLELVPTVNTAPLSAAQTVPSTVDSSFASGTISFRPGTDVGSKRYVPKGQTFAFRFSAIVQPNPKSVVDVQGNLAKLRWSDRAGKVSSLRDLADFRVPPVPPVAIDKTVTKTPGSGYVDGVSAVHDNILEFQVKINNNGTTPVSTLDVWDVLPQPFRCADITQLDAPGVCTDPGDAGHPSFTGNGTQSAIRWKQDVSATLAPAATRTVLYRVKVPSTTSVGTDYTNTAYVRSFTTPTNLGGAGITHFPASNVDTSVPVVSQDAPAASDPARLTLPKVSLTKSSTTSVVEPNNTASQAVPGETVTYTIRASVPAHTTVYNGVLTDPMPTNLVFGSATAAYSATGASPAVDPLPAGASLNAANGTLTLPPTVTNATSTAQVYEVTIVAKVDPTQIGDATRTNTATFTSSTTLGGSTKVPNVTATSAVAIVHPTPSIAKRIYPDDSASSPAAGESRTFQLTASGGTARPTSYDVRVVDCVPTGLTVTGFLLPTSGITAVPTVAGDACASVPGTGTTISWNLPSIASGSTASNYYTVKVDDSAAGGQAYTNIARITASSLQDGANDATKEQVLTSTATRTLTVPSATIAKTVADPKRAVGERATYTVTAKLPANATFFNASISDTLPAGLDAASIATTSVACTDSDGACPLPSNGTAMTRNGQTVGWYFGDLASSARERTITVTFTALVPDNCSTVATASCNTIGKTRSNTAVVRWDLTDKTDPTTAGSTQDRSVTSTPVDVTVQEPRTAVTKSVVGTTPAPGDSFTYSVTVSDVGGTNVSDAHDVVVKDVVPAGVAVDESTITGGGTYAAATRTITWNVPLLTAAAGADHAKTFTYTAKLAASGTIDGTALANTVKVTSYESLPTGGRTYTDGPQATATVTPRLPHTSVAKRVVGSDVSYVGEAQNFEIVVTSDGSSPAYKVDVKDVLPRSWALGTATVKIGSGTAQVVPPSTSTTTSGVQTVTWDDLAASGLAPGQTIVIAYTATPQPGALTDAGAGSTKAHTNTVSINAEDATGASASGKGAYNGGPATATARIHAADLRIAKSAVGTPVAGQAFTWKIKVHNNGGDPATGPIVVKDTIPAGVTDLSLSGTGWTCSSTTTEWTCVRSAAIASGGDADDITATGTIPSDLAGGTSLSNTATVSAHTYDPAPADNSSTATTAVTVLADLSIVKRLIGNVTAGQDATWTLDVTNLGPSTSRGPIVVKDTLPADATFVSATGTGWTCHETGGVVTCERAADLPATGASSADQITVVAKISASQTGAVENTASVTSTTEQPISRDAQDNNTDEVTTTPTRTADLFLQKSLKGTTNAVAGSPATYVLDVTNNGPSTATGVKVTDTLPSYLTFVSGSGSGWSCSAADQLVTCTLTGSLGVGEKKTVELTVDVVSGHTGDIENTAKVVATEDPTGSTDDDTNTPDLVSDLQVQKTHVGDATAGRSVTYTVKVTNEGSSDTAGPIVVEDTVPDGMTFASDSSTAWDCDEDTGTVTCTFAGGMVDGDSKSFDLTFDVAPDAGPATVVNNVSVDGPNTDPTSGNNTDSDDTDIVDDADVKVIKSVGVTSVHAGNEVTWTIDVTNAGPSTADSVSVSDALPAGVTVTSIDGTGWTCTKAPLACSRESLAPGAAPTITVVTTVGSGVAEGTRLTNVAEVTTSTPGDDTSDNDDDASVETTTSADMALVKTHTGTPVAGQPFTFTLTATNDGPSDAQGPITIDDHLPVGMSYVSANDAWSCVASPVSNTGQDVICTLVSGGPVVTGTDATALVMRVDVAADQSGRTLVNEAGVESATTDPDTADNDDTDSVTPTDGVDLSIVKSHTGPVEVGKQLSFAIAVHNDGPSEARDVEVEDTLPTGLTFVSASGAGWTCATGSTTCTLDAPLAPNADAAPLTVVAEVTPQAYPDVTNVATVSTSSDDADDTNDESSDQVDVPAKVDLSIVKKLSGPLTVGQEGTYSLTVRNDGPTADPGPVTVTDQLPAGLTFVSANAAGWDCAAADQLVTCSRTGTFAIDASDTIDLRVKVGAAAYPRVTNTASVASPSVDVDPDDNTSGVPAPVAGQAQLTIKKTLDSHDGDQAVWKIAVTNQGPTETTAPVVVTDQLPRTLTRQSVKGDGWSCGAGRSRTISCTYAGTLAVGQTATLTVSTRITVDDGSKVTNVASVVGGNTVGGTDDGPEVSDDATVRAPKDEDSGSSDGGLLPDTGGPGWWLLMAAVLGLAVGGSMTVRARRH